MTQRNDSTSRERKNARGRELRAQRRQNDPEYRERARAYNTAWCREHREQRNARAKARKRERYRSDPEYRERRKAQAREWRRKQTPEARERGNARARERRAQLRQSNGGGAQ